MKLLKIGSSSSCNIVIGSDYVSSLHAELLIFDDGRMVLQDKNSMNGTFIGNMRITPNKDYPVQRGDLIRFGDKELKWSQIPMHYGPQKDEKWYNIGTGLDCEIPVVSQFTSRYHAILKIRNGKAYILDNDSKNGTLVNGNKIGRGKEVQITRKSSVICGDVDVTEDIKRYIPNHWGWLKIASISVAAAAVVVGAWFAIQSILVDYVKKYQPAVVYVDAAYHYKAVFDNNSISKEIWDGVIAYPVSQTYSATAFFIDQHGVMATNRHVAMPWEYQSDDVKTKIRNDIREYFQDPLNKCRSTSDIQRLADTPLGNYIIQQWLNSLGHTPQSSSDINKLNSIINGVKNASFTLEGEIDYVTVGYPGRYYSHRDEYERCFVLAESGDREKDVALLQLNKKATPAEISANVLDINHVIYTGKMSPMKAALTWIGYPRGMDWAKDETIHSLQPVVRSTHISKNPSLNSFELEGELIPGASGSPVFDSKNGKLYGVIFGAWQGGTTFSHACKVQCIKDLYDANLPVIEQ